jgi:hypothetical protein
VARIFNAVHRVQYYHHINYIVLMSQIFISTIAISRPRQEKPPVTIKEILSIGGNGEFIRIEEVTSDQHGNIYVTDAYRYSVKKFSPTGTLLEEYGKRGNDPADFRTSPYKIICHDKTVAVATKGSGYIQLFINNFVFIGRILLPGAITDIIFDHHGRIVAGIIPYDQSEHRILFLLDKSGKIIASTPSYKKEEGPAFNMMHITAGKENTIIVAYRFINTVAIYTDELKLIKTFTVPDLLPEAPYRTGTSEEIGKIPEGDLIKDVGTDPNGNIFILGGDFNDTPNRIVYLFDPGGNYLARFHLPQKSGILYIDNYGNIYTRENERIIFKKYCMTYRKKGMRQP